MPQEPKETRKRKRIHPNSLKNLKPPIKPGEVLNREGKNQHDEAAKIARAVFQKYGVKIEGAMAKRVLKGDVYAFNSLADRGYGKVDQKVKVDGSLTADCGKRLAELLTAAAQRAGKAS